MRRSRDEFGLVEGGLFVYRGCAGGLDWRFFLICLRRKKIGEELMRLVLGWCWRFTVLLQVVWFFLGFGFVKGASSGGKS